MTNPADIAAYWDTAAPAFDEEPDHGLGPAATRAAWARLLAGLLPGAPADVLDAGCGTGSLSALLAGEGHRVTGVDLSPRMVALARAKLADAGLPGHFLVGDAGRPPTGEGHFDAVLCRHLLWTLPDPGAALREWTARLRPGGTLVLIEGRWHTPGADAQEYVPGADDLPWHGGVGAEDLASALAALTTDVHLTPLSGNTDLWGGPVRDERYALVARM